MTSHSTLYSESKKPSLNNDIDNIDNNHNYNYNYNYNTSSYPQYDPAAFLPPMPYLLNNNNNTSNTSNTTPTTSSANIPTTNLMLQDFKFTPRCLTPINFDYNALLFQHSDNFNNNQTPQSSSSPSFTYPQQPSLSSYNYTSPLTTDSPSTSISSHLRSNLLYSLDDINDDDNDNDNDDNNKVDTMELSNNLHQLPIVLPSQGDKDSTFDSLFYNNNIKRENSIYSSDDDVDEVDEVDDLDDNMSTSSPQSSDYEYSIPSSRRRSSINPKRSSISSSTTTTTREKQFRCKKCSSSFTRKTRLTEHINRVHLGKVLHFKCNQCGTRLSSKENLTRHSIVHTDKFKCPHCNRRFDRSYRFQRHLEKCGN